MAATAAQIAELRRMVNEPDDTTYDDDALMTYIESYPLMDERGEDPYTWDTSTTPPSEDENDDWVDTYDLNAAAGDIWSEKAAVLAQDFDFGADGGRYTRSQPFVHAMRMASYYRSRRSAKTITQVMYPKPSATEREDWVVNKLPTDKTKELN